MVSVYLIQFVGRLTNLKRHAYVFFGCLSNVPTLTNLTINVKEGKPSSASTSVSGQITKHPNQINKTRVIQCVSPAAFFRALGIIKLYLHIQYIGSNDKKVRPPKYRSSANEMSELTDNWVDRRSFIVRLPNFLVIMPIIGRNFLDTW